MISRCSEGRYKDVPAVILENDILRVTVTPGFGARTASLIYKPRDRELLWQNPAESHARPEYGDGYEKGEFAGFDEMFPTISRCFYQHEPWKGTELPDHGEVWSIPWKYELGEASAEFTVRGVRFPYELSKKITLEGRIFRAEYTLSNFSSFPFSCIWAAHPLFNTEEGAEFIVPAGMDTVINSVPGTVLGEYGKEYRFPAARRGPAEIDLSRMPPRNGAGYQKYYFKDPVPEGWCLMYLPRAGLNIGMSYPAETVRYLGMWLNEGGFAGQYNIAPEPATAGMDRTDAAELWGMDSIVGPGETKKWYLNISAAEGGRSCRVDNRGNIILK